MKKLAIKSEGAVVDAQENELNIDKSAEVAKGLDTEVSKIKSRVISFRVTAEQHKEMSNKCNDAEGVQLIKLAELARLSLLTQRVVNITEDPLDRYRLAIAAEMSSGITSIVQVLDRFMDMNEGQISLSDFVKITQYLEAILRRSGELMALLYKNESSHDDY